MDGRQFELEVTRVLIDKGFLATHTGAGRNGDDGIDILVSVQGKTIIVQCKSHKAFISPGVVRELYGTLVNGKYDEAWHICTSGYYSGARSFASGKPIRLLTMRDVLDLSSS